MKHFWLLICAHTGTLHDSYLHYSILTSLIQRKKDLVTEADFKDKIGHSDNLV